jgi:hypothetical protein
METEEVGTPTQISTKEGDTRSVLRGASGKFTSKPEPPAPVPTEISTKEGTTRLVHRASSGMFARKPKPPTPPISVYMLSSTDGKWQKIGMSKQPSKRLSEINVPFDLTLVYHTPVEDARSVESKLHSFFGDRHVKGEWFTGLGREEFVNAMYKFSENKTKSKCKQCGGAMLT